MSCASLTHRWHSITARQGSWWWYDKIRKNNDPWLNEGEVLREANIQSNWISSALYIRFLACMLSLSVCEPLLNRIENRESHISECKKLGRGAEKQFSSPIKSGWGLASWVRDLVCLPILTLNSKHYCWRRKLIAQKVFPKSQSWGPVGRVPASKPIVWRLRSKFVLLEKKL